MLDGHRLVDLNGSLLGCETSALSAGWIGKRRGRLWPTTRVHAKRHRVVLTDAATVRACAAELGWLGAVCRGQDGLNRHDCQNKRCYELGEPLHLNKENTRRLCTESVILIASLRISNQLRPTLDHQQRGEKRRNGVDLERSDRITANHEVAPAAAICIEGQWNGPRRGHL